MWSKKRASEPAQLISGCAGERLQLLELADEALSERRGELACVSQSEPDGLFRL